MKTIQLDLPDPVVDFIHSLSKDESLFAMEVIDEKIAREKKTKLETLLKEGYHAAAKEDLIIAKDFSFADFENL